MGLRKLAVAVVLGCYLATSTSVALAGMIGTQQFLSATDREHQLARVMQVLDRQDVQTQLVALGVDPGEAQARVAALSDQELTQMADRLDQMPAGGDSLLAVIGIVFVVLLILDLLGVTHIFNLRR